MTSMSELESREETKMRRRFQAHGTSRTEAPNGMPLAAPWQRFVGFYSDLLLAVLIWGPLEFGWRRLVLQEFRASGGTATEETIASSGRALERAEAIVHAKLKRGLSVLATIGATAPFVGLLGTVIGILHAFQQIATQKTSGIGAVAGGISEALVTTAFGLLVAIPAVMTFNYFTGRVENFDVEMDNSSSELVDYFIKQSHKR